MGTKQKKVFIFSTILAFAISVIFTIYLFKTTNEYETRTGNYSYKINIVNPGPQQRIKWDVNIPNPAKPEPKRFCA